MLENLNSRIFASDLFPSTLAITTNKLYDGGDTHLIALAQGFLLTCQY